MNLVVRIPAENGYSWTDEAAATAVGKPLLDRVGDGARKIGVIRSAYAEHDDLVLTVEIDNAAVQLDLRTDEVRCIALVPKPRVAEQ